jgi:hypothetical protein
VKSVNFQEQKEGIYERKKFMTLKETVRKNIRDLYRDTNKIKKDYNPTANLIKHENNILADSHNILNTSVSFRLYMALITLGGQKCKQQWKKSIIVPIYKSCDKTDCSNYRGISLLRTTYKILSNIILSKLTPYVDEITGDHQCGFRRNRSTTDQKFCSRYILKKNMGK